MKSSNIETELRDLFDVQQRSVQPRQREWSDTGEIAMVDMVSAPANARRRYGAAVVGFAAVVALGIVVVSIREPNVVVKPNSGSESSIGARLDVSTGYVDLTADDFSIDVGGKRFVGTRPMEVHGDPGGTSYQTLELQWMEHGVPMRWYIYLKSDGNEWWSQEMRTRDGRSPDEWVTFTGEFFRSPLGTPFVGDLDVTATDHGVTSRLRAKGLRLRGFGVISDPQPSDPVQPLDSAATSTSAE